MKRNFCFSFAAGLVLLHLITSTEAQVCANGFQCLSCTQGQVCVAGAPLGDPITCPANTYCLNTNAQICTAGTCPTFTCTTAGRFPDVYSPNRYILCVPDATQPTGFIQITIPCPTGSTFNPTTTQCVPITTTTSTTPSTTTSTTTTTAATTTTVATTTPIYTCASIGRYPDARNCSIYYMCQTNPAGGFYVYKYICPATTLFNAATEKCTKAANSGCTISSG